MIRNIIFDMGRVVLSISFRGVMREMGFREPAVEELRGILDRMDFWRRMDEGAMTLDEGLDFFAGQTQYQEEAREFLLHYDQYMREMPGTIAFMKDAKAAGMGIYYLSNFQEHTWKRIEQRGFFALYDGGVVSWQAKLLKPDERIYRLLCDTYGLRPEECLFIDDFQENIDGARQCGIHGIWYDYDNGMDLYAAAREYGVALGEKNGEGPAC